MDIFIKNKKLWKPTRKVWFQKNDDDNLGKEELIEQANENISKIWNPENKYKRTQKEILRRIRDD